MTTDPRLVILKWPDELAHILPRLERTTFQQFHEFKTDSGDVLRRPKHSQMPAFKGTLELNQSERRMLDAFYRMSLGRHFSFKDPETEATVYAVFGPQPFDREIHRFLGTSDPEWATYTVDILIVETTSLIEKALEAGVVSLG